MKACDSTPGRTGAPSSLQPLDALATTQALPRMISLQFNNLTVHLSASKLGKDIVPTVQVYLTPSSQLLKRIARVEGDGLDTNTGLKQDSMPHLSDSVTPAPLDKSATQKPQLLVMWSPSSPALEDMLIPVSPVPVTLQVKEQSKFTPPIRVLSGPPGQLLLTREPSPPGCVDGYRALVEIEESNSTNVTKHMEDMSMHSTALFATRPQLLDHKEIFFIGEKLVWLQGSRPGPMPFRDDHPGEAYVSGFDQ
ncbi:hypothetical protein HPB51_010566 [Rhipicephalus microplus]|uniref:Uncharacterized protein n=1 Tax=Rhipicephalus microplus TaxID=6941 RepID=A0A9J6E957_RHIMP|nr:hypothetical protein HPB51_010566 [Rhipicephalus microplus]